ncbi:MAG: TonB-dependent receptor, partial [Saprospiraceae bacterium]
MQFKILLTLILAHTTLSAQVVQGIVKDKSGNPIEITTVMIKSTQNHVHTDENGKYAISEAKAGDTLVIQQMFYETKELMLTSENMEQTIITTLDQKPFELSHVVITPNINALKTLSQIDLQTKPVNSSQELLRQVPGLFIGQHAGGGKAEQIFLRGFDIDHGTDVLINVDGIPINMVSHAHGQGYADMHFIMPEIIENITYNKGPYDVDKGNFATAGYVAFKTKDHVKESILSTEIGSFNTKRITGLFSIMDKTNESAYFASEYLLSDGPFEATQAFQRFNIFAKYTKTLENNDKFSIWTSRFTSRWDASGQIPQRAVASGQISRFGAIDNTEGGQTSRSNLHLNYTKYMSNDAYLKTNAYISSYYFQLFSNFTFFLMDSIHGDQIKQKEKRNTYGANTEFHFKLSKSASDLRFRLGVGLRYDDINDVELFNTLQRKSTLQNLALGDIDESNLFSYGDVTFENGPIQITTGIRADYFNFVYQDKLP